MTWRYTTNPVTCQREWRWYPSVGPAERAVTDVQCVRLPTRTVPAFVATPPAAAALPKIAIAAGLAGTAGTVGIVALGTHLAAGPASSAVTAPAPVAGPAWTEVQIPAPGVRSVDVGPVTPVPEPASVLVLLVPVLVVVLLGRVRRATGSQALSLNEIPFGAVRPPTGAATAGQGANQ